MKINYEMYQDPELIPITGIAEVLGMEPDAKGKYLCPCHDDHTPSMQITTSGTFANRFHCWGCGENGGPLDLVIAVKYHINPSAYKKNPEEYWKVRNHAARFIEKYYPGAVVDESCTKKEDKDGIPDIPMKILKEIGLKPSVLIQHSSGRNPLSLSDEEMVNMVCDCIYAKEDNLSEYLDKIIFENFPQISKESRRYITHTIAAQQEDLEKYASLCKEYLKKHTGYDYSRQEYEKENIRPFIQKNMDAIAKLHKQDNQFPVLPVNLVSQIGKKVNVFRLLQAGVSPEDIADALSKALLDVATDMKNYKTRILKDFPMISDEDKRYIKETVRKNENVLNRCYLALERYLDRECECEFEKE